MMKMQLSISLFKPKSTYSFVKQTNKQTYIYTRISSIFLGSLKQIAADVQQFVAHRRLYVDNTTISFLVLLCLDGVEHEIISLWMPQCVCPEFVLFGTDGVCHGQRPVEGEVGLEFALAGVERLHGAVMEIVRVGEERVECLAVPFYVFKLGGGQCNVMKPGSRQRLSLDGA